jgi:hypothetical protein
MPRRWPSGPSTSATTSKSLADRHCAGGPKPVIVLEHGEWADGSSRGKVVRRPQGDGFTVYAPPNPLRGLPKDSAYLNDFLTRDL